MSELFVNYRRDDTRWAAGRICDRLHRDLGESRVFLDSITIEPGEDFVEAIGARVETCRALLSVIGPRWLELMKEREGDADDYLRIELSQAISRGVRLIPLTVDGVRMPRETDLPPEIAALSRYQAVPIRADTFDSDMAPLTEFLQRFLSEPAPAPAPMEKTAPSPPIAAKPGSALALNHRTEFWKTTDKGADYFKIFVWLEGDDTALDQVDRVIYRLHPTFKNPVREIKDRAHKFELRTNGWGEFEISAIAYNANGQPIADMSRWLSFD